MRHRFDILCVSPYRPDLRRRKRDTEEGSDWVETLRRVEEDDEEEERGQDEEKTGLERCEGC